MRLGLGLGVNKGRKSGFVQDAAITALLDQAATDGATPMSGATLTAANTLVTDLKSAGVWDKLDLFYVFATNGDEAFARYNWKDPSTFQATETGAGALTFTSLEGFTGDGTNYLDTGWDAVNNGVNFLLDSASYGVYSRTNNTSRGEIGEGSISRNYLWIRGASGNTFRINSGTASSAAVTPSDGFFHANRDGSTSSTLYKNGSSIDTEVIASTDLSSIDFNIFRAITISTKQLSIAFIGGDLSAEAGDFYTAVQAFMTSIGSQV